MRDQDSEPANFMGMSTIRSATMQGLQSVSTATQDASNLLVPLGTPSLVKLQALSKRREQTRMRVALSKLLDEPQSSRWARAFFVLLLLAILTSVLIFFLKTIPDLSESKFMLSLDDACMILFCVELGARIVVGTMDVKQLLLLNFYFWLDAASISPFVFEQFIKLQTMMFCEQRSKADSWDGWSANASYVWEANASDTTSLGDSTGALEVSSSCGGSIELPAVILSLQLLRVLRALKLMRHLFDLRVLTVALAEAGRPVLLPAAAMMVVILVLSGALWLLETDPESEDAFGNAFDALWCVFWLVCSLGFDGPMGTGGVSAKLIIATAVASGLVLTTMPITIIGEAFANAWNRKELLTLQARVNDELVKRALSVNDFRLLFAEIDANADGELDWAEFKAAMRKLGLFLPNQKMRSLFEKLDLNSQGSVSCAEMSRVLFPDHDWEELAQDKKKLQRSIEEAAAVVIQKWYRGYRARYQVVRATNESKRSSIGDTTALVAAAQPTSNAHVTYADSAGSNGRSRPVQIQLDWLEREARRSSDTSCGEHAVTKSSLKSRVDLKLIKPQRTCANSRPADPAASNPTPVAIGGAICALDVRMQRLEAMMARSLAAVEQLSQRLPGPEAPAFAGGDNMKPKRAEVEAIIRGGDEGAFHEQHPEDSLVMSSITSMTTPLSPPLRGGELKGAILGGRLARPARSRSVSPRKPASLTATPAALRTVRLPMSDSHAPAVPSDGSP